MIGMQVEAATLVVDDDGMASVASCDATTMAYTTISGAVAAASANDTIIVCPGLYLEQVTIDKTLTLRGARFNVDARTRPFVPANESIIDHPCGPVQIEADKVVLNGFTIQGSTLPDPCFLSGIWTNPGFSGTNGGHQILNNIVQSNISGIELDSNCVYPTLVQFNLIQNNSNPGPGSGNGIQTNFGLCRATIDRNKFSGDTSSSVLVVAASANLTITNNELVAPTPESISLLNVTAATISGNVSTGSTNSSTIDLFGGNSDVMITSNTLLNGIRAIVVDNPFSSFGVPQNTNIVAHLNCIQGNSLAGMEVDPSAYPTTPALNAENNWWGSPSGPSNPSNPTGTGDRIIDPDNNVDFTPWLTSPPAGCPQVPNTPGKATGGGKIQSDPLGLDIVLELATLLIRQSFNPTSVGSQATFGFSVSCCAPRGNLEYNDHQANVQISAMSIESFVISASAACPTGKHAQFKGQASEQRTTGTQQVGFTVDVDDCGEPGSTTAGGTDMFKIQTFDYMAGGPLIGGNIQIKQ
jgi:nitrous oxidase accessory protein NosD